jgi:hypothetical protein
MPTRSAAIRTYLRGGLVWFDFSACCARYSERRRPLPLILLACFFKTCSRSGSFGNYCLVALSGGFPGSSASVMRNFSVCVRDLLQSLESLWTP